ncbi:amidase [Brevundimonas bullata]|uniref:amidase n=1 Tax=Brevundimonas bullata TaxID=13160 RepID=UPI003A5235D5
MAHLSRLPRPHHWRAGARKGGLILAAVSALALTACAIPNDDGSWTLAGEDGGRIFQPPTAAAIVDGVYPSRAALAGAREITLSADSALPGPPSAVIAMAPSVMADETPVASGLLKGLPVLLKDNIETRDMPTTAGSLALADNAPGRDAPLVVRLRDAGAIILGKTNLSEWANIRSSESISGWSAVGGQTRNPYAPERTPCGSSSGSAAAVAIGLAPVAIGTETDGSITCPAAVNGVVGFKPTVGLVSRTHIVPISHSQDTAGPMAVTVEDAAIVLTVIAGSDPADPATVEADARKVDYRAALDANSLRGARIGVMRFLLPSYSAETRAEFERALAALRAAGAEVVEIEQGPADLRAIGGWELTVLLTELKHDLNAYLASTDPTQVKTRTLADVIAFNAAEPRETVLFGQDLFERAQATGGLNDHAYVEARANSLQAAGPDGIDRMMTEHRVVALIAPTTSRAWTNDPKDEDEMQGSASRLAAVAGYPHLTVPMGFDRGMPVGLSFIGGKWDDARILSLGHAYEQATRERRPPPLP